MCERYNAQMKNEIMTVTRVNMWLSCEHGVEASKVRFFVAHLIHLFNVTMAMPCTGAHSGAPVPHFLNRPDGMDCQALNFRPPANYVFEMSRMHACL